MYSIKLDDNKYFTGAYALVGGIEGGVQIESLPPQEDTNKWLYYKYDYYDITVTDFVPVIDEATQLQKEVDGVLQFTEVPRTESVLGWVLDEEKYNTSLVDQLEALKKQKKVQLGTMCEQIIAKGLDIETSVGVEHFSFNEKNHDQTNIKNAYDIAKATNLSVLYHADDTACRVFTPQEMLTLYVSMMQYITYNTTLINMLNTWVKRCTTIEEINAIEYTSQLPEDLQALLDSNLAQASLVVQAMTNTPA